ncbi:MAG: hypothetical protein H6834_12675 [Planctomycetes bacterium]|nr:hypothetical protein [Planctomycetota bacterium]
MSGNGRFITFETRSLNLFPWIDPRGTCVALFDRETFTTTLVNVNAAGQQANGNCERPSVSDDGRFVAFQSDAWNIAPGLSRYRPTIYVRDRVSMTTEWVTQSLTGDMPNGNCENPLLSATGRFVAFDSRATDLINGDSNGLPDVFVFDRQARAMERVSLTTSGAESNGPSFLSDMSPDGRFVCVWSDATNIVAGDANGIGDIFLYDRSAGTLTIESVSTSGAQVNQRVSNALVSASGRFLAFSTQASSLDPNDWNGKYDVYVRDRQAGTTVLASLSPSGTLGDEDSLLGGISNDGRYLTFTTASSNYLPSAANIYGNVFLRDTLNQTTRLVSTDPQGGYLQYGAMGGALSEDGRWLIVRSTSTELAPTIRPSANIYWQIYITDLQCPGSAHLYDFPCMGSNQKAPFLYMAGCPDWGQTLTMGLRAGLGNAPGVFLFGTGRQSVPIGSSCSLLLSNLLLSTALPITLDSSGQGALTVQLPPSPGYPGTATLQALLLDSGTTQGITTTHAVEVSLR